MLGRTGLAVSPIGFGAWAIGGNRFGNSYGPTDDAESLRAVRRAYDLGCNFFDTADVYGHGHSEQLLGEALAGIRQRVLVATKVGGNFYNRGVNPLLLGRIAEAVGRPVGELAPDVPLPVTHDADFSPEYVRFAVEQSLRRLATDYIDLLQLHNPALSLIAVMLFMVVYYRLSGANAVVALLLNLVILLAFMAMSGAVLTLPGIAGVILTIGMGVDSNVLVFERIREELRNGKSPASAVDAGFDKAFLPENLPSPRIKFPKGKEGNVKPYGGGVTPLRWLKSGELELSSEDMMLSRDDGKSYTGLLRFTISFDAQHKASVKTVGKTKTEVEE